MQPTLDELGPLAVPMTGPASTVLFSEGAVCQGFPLVLEGEQIQILDSAALRTLAAAIGR